jgi:shikimate kinase
MIAENKIFLIGFMGSGKSTLGKKLANKLQQTFFDLDTEIEAVESRSISEIFENSGEDYFRKIERETLLNLIEKNNDFVMSIGGGTPCYNNNMDLINQTGLSIYLKYNPGILTSRLINAKKNRPLIKGKNKEELMEFIENTLLERELFYNKSQFVVEKNNVKVEDVIFLIQ